MTRRPSSLCCALLSLVALVAGPASVPGQSSAAQPPPAESKMPPPVTAKKTGATHANPAERVFQSNCSRCHYAPESLSPRITGTVVRHMRVRANLSAEEERMILKYLNP
jgi:cytochrome c5